MRVRTAVAAVCAVAILVGEQLEAQPSAVPAGARVRLIEAGTRYWAVGAMERQASHDTIWFASANGSRAFETGQVDALQVSRGKHRPLYYTLAPAYTIPVGAGTFGLMGVFFAIGDPYNPEEVVAWSIGIGAAVGAVAGIILATRPVEEVWQPVSLNPTRQAAKVVSSGSPVVAVGDPGPGVLLKPGAHVRVRRPGARPMDGTVLEQHADTAVLLVSGTTAKVDVTDASELAIDMGRSRSLGARVGALWGIGGGVALGLAAAGRSNAGNDYRDPDCEPSVESCARDSDFETVYYTAVGGAAIGAALGAIIGKRKWTRVSVPRRQAAAPRFMVTPRGRQLAVGFTANF